MSIEPVDVTGFDLFLTDERIGLSVHPKRLKRQSFNQVIALNGAECSSRRNYWVVISSKSLTADE
jgi:hypothetical protein